MYPMGTKNRLESILWSNEYLCEFEEDQVKTLLCGLHTRKEKVGPKWQQMSLMGGNIILGS